MLNIIQQSLFPCCFFLARFKLQQDQTRITLLNIAGDNVKLTTTASTSVDPCSDRCCQFAWHCSVCDSCFLSATEVQPFQSDVLLLNFLWLVLCLFLCLFCCCCSKQIAFWSFTCYNQPTTCIHSFSVLYNVISARLIQTRLRGYFCGKKAKCHNFHLFAALLTRPYQVCNVIDQTWLHLSAIEPTRSYFSTTNNHGENVWWTAWLVYLVLHTGYCMSVP